MKVRMLTSLAGSPGYQFGDEVDLPNAVAEAWIRERRAEAVTVEPAADLRKKRAATAKSGREHAERATADPADDPGSESRH